MRLLLDLTRNRIAQAKFNTAWNSAIRNYSFVKTIWTTIDLRQNNDLLSVDGMAKIVGFDDDGKQVYETEPKFHYYFRTILTEEIVNLFTVRLATMLQKANEEEQLKHGDIFVEVANYGEEFAT